MYLSSGKREVNWENASILLAYGKYVNDLSWLVIDERVWTTVDSSAIPGGGGVLVLSYKKKKGWVKSGWAKHREQGSK